MVNFARGLENAILGSIGLAGQGCSLARFKPAFPANQTVLVAPAATPEFLGIAFGVQNYTCSAAGTFASAGALAEVIDASCLAQDAAFASAPQALLRVWDAVPASVPIIDIIDLLHAADPPAVLAQHYFIPNPATGAGLSPVWDLRSSGVRRFRGDPDGVLVGRPNATLPAPTDPAVDIPWLDVDRLQGDVAGRLFRFATVGGQPPASCKAGQTASVKYTANYVFYK